MTIFLYLDKSYSFVELQMSRITQNEAYDIYISHKRICSDAVFQIIQNLGVPDDQFETIRRKLRNLQKSRYIYSKKNILKDWENAEFYSVSTVPDFGSQMSLDTIDPIPEQTTFIEENSTEIRKPLLKLTMKAARYRLSILLQHVQFVAQREQVEEKKITALLLELISNKEYDRETSKVCN